MRKLSATCVGNFGNSDPIPNTKKPQKTNHVCYIY